MLCANGGESGFRAIIHDLEIAIGRALDHYSSQECANAFADAG